MLRRRPKSATAQTSTRTQQNGDDTAQKKGNGKPKKEKKGVSGNGIRESIYKLQKEKKSQERQVPGSQEDGLGLRRVYYCPTPLGRRAFVLGVLGSRLGVVRWC